MAEIFNYEHRVEQKTMTGLRGSLEEDKLSIKFELWNRARNDPFAHKIRELSDIWVRFSRFKEASTNGSKKVYKGLLCAYLTGLRVPIGERPAIANNIFDVVAAAVSPLDPVLVTVWRFGGGLSIPKMIPASRSSIQGLEPVTLVDTDNSLCCTICCADFEQECQHTRLPCKHHFHVHCVVQWLEISHLCPLCRYAMPTQE